MYPTGRRRRAALRARPAAGSRSFAGCRPATAVTSSYRWLCSAPRGRSPSSCSCRKPVAEVEPDERGLASGIFETADHLFGGAVGVAHYASVLTAMSTTASDADGYRAAYLAATGLALLGLVAASQARPVRGPPAHPIDADRRRRRVPQRGPVAERRRR